MFGVDAMGLKLPNGLVGSRPDWSRRRGDVSASRQLLSEPSRRRCIGPQAVLSYLARYTHRVAISNSRLLTLDQAEAKLKVRPLRPVRWSGAGAQHRERPNAGPA